MKSREVPAVCGALLNREAEGGQVSVAGTNEIKTGNGIIHVVDPVTPPE